MLTLLATTAPKLATTLLHLIAAAVPHVLAEGADRSEALAESIAQHPHVPHSYQLCETHVRDGLCTTTYSVVYFRVRDWFYDVEISTYTECALTTSASPVLSVPRIYTTCEK